MMFGYTKEELELVGTEGCNMGLSCGKPTSKADLQLNEVVLDLGCGAGVDCLLASKQVGPKGKVIGIDMSEDMIKKAKSIANKKSITNVEYYLSEIENMKQVKDNHVDCVISNCVLNLVPNKLNAFKEIYRVVKPNGRLAISDIALKKPIPDDLQNEVVSYIAGYVSCISGAILVDEYKDIIKQAGFREVKFESKNIDLNTWKQAWNNKIKNVKKNNDGGCCSVSSCDNDDMSCCGGNPLMGINFTPEQIDKISKILDDVDLNEYIGSYYIFGVK
jgi:arsenite methyltransferase